MAIFYLDTSVIVERYRTEEGTHFVDILFDTVFTDRTHSLSTSTLAVVEFIAAMRRSLRGNVITQNHFENAIYHFNRELNDISLRPITEGLMVRAVDVVMNHALRTADAIHIATVLELRDIMAGFQDPIILVSNDVEMCDAGIDEGIEVISAADNTIDRLNSLLGIS